MAYFKGIDQSDTIYFYLASHHYVKILNFFGILKVGEKAANRNFFENLALKFFCNSYFSLCDFLIEHFTDKDSVLIDHDQINWFLKFVPSRTSTKSISHFSQLLEHKDDTKFTQFDYGTEENQKRYGQDTPPLYPIENIKLPVLIYYGENDLLSTEDNNELLISELPNVKGRKLKEYGHITYQTSITLELLMSYLLEDLK